jgi:hypothetical protein
MTVGKTPPSAGGAGFAQWLRSAMVPPPVGCPAVADGIFMRPRLVAVWQRVDRDRALRHLWRGATAAEHG